MSKLLRDSPKNRLGIRITITLLKFYAPLCVGYTIWGILVGIWPSLSLGYDLLLDNILLWAIGVLEAVFYVFFIWYARNIQSHAIHPPLRSRQERLDLFDQVHEEIHDFEGFLRGWFHGAMPEEIGRDELRKWIDWAFWEGRAREAGEQGDEVEMNTYIHRIEQLMGKPFQEGPGQAKSLRLTLDTVTIEPRSLAWYSFIMLQDTIAIILLKSKGLKYYRSPLTSLAIFPPRPAALCTRAISIAPSLSYFLRKHTSKTRLPVVYLHGIGIGILPYIDFLEQMHASLNSSASTDDQVGILVVEILQISSRLTSPILRQEDFITQLTALVNYHFGLGRSVLVSHSYGTILSSQILRDQSLSSRISGTLLIDPVSMLLHMPDVAYNFTVRKPIRANEWVLWWFGSRDPQVAHTLGRHFFWSECVLWRDRIEELLTTCNMRLTTSLASDDLIVNTHAVKDYLTRGKVPDSSTFKPMSTSQPAKLQAQIDENLKVKEWCGAGLEVLWWSGYDHGEVLHTREDRAKLAKIVVEYCNGS